jgi:RNA-directed DNA polymerase
VPLQGTICDNLYSCVGSHNFLNYAFKAARVMNDPGIEKQVKKHWRRLREEIERG